jgi:hypothetical protein
MLPRYFDHGTRINQKIDFLLGAKNGANSPSNRLRAKLDLKTIFLALKNLS